MLKKLLAVILSVMILCVIGLSSVTAQTNLLQDPSFEHVGDYKVVQAAENAVFAVPPAWNGWVTLAPRAEDWQNRMPNGFPHTGLFKIDGARSLSISRGFATFTTAVYQSVTVESGTNLRGSARGFMERGVPPVDGGQFRVGIDPDGGADPFAPEIIWSPWVTTEDGWQQATVDATATGGTVTLFLYSTQTQPSDPNVIYWDDAVLAVGGGGGTSGQNTANPAITNTPVIPTPAFADFVDPQATKTDGSIIHTVQPGDTIDAIAAAYRVTRQQILDLNDIGTGRFIQPGQQLIIRPPSEAEESVEETVEVTIQVIAQSTSEDATGDDSASEDAETAEPTVTASPTATRTPEPATSTPTDLPPAPVTQVAQVNDVDVTGVTAVCVWMFNDGNQNRIQEEAEALLEGGSIVINSGDSEVEAYTTDGASEPFCFDDFAVGSYTVSANAPEGYGLTTAPELSLRVQSGTRVDARFGAAEGVESVAPPAIDASDTDTQVVAEPVEEADNTTNLLQLSGLVVFGLAALVLVGGIGVALIMRNR